MKNKEVFCECIINPDKEENHNCDVNLCTSIDHVRKNCRCGFNRGSNSHHRNDCKFCKAKDLFYSQVKRTYYNNMKKKIRDHLWLFRIQIMQLERNANEGKITREEAVKEFDANLEIFTQRVYEEFLGVGKLMQKIFEDNL